jgi:tetratricopeptide (TPR) repeat protein
LQSSIFGRLRPLLVLAAVAGAAVQAQALPAFVQKEGKGCAYCHVNEKGAGPRNYRGVYYKENGLSFAKFDDAAEAKKAGVEIGPEPTPPPKSLTPADPAAAEPKPQEPAPAEGPAAEPSRPSSATPTLTIAQARANLRSAETQHKKAPKDPARKRAYAEALAQLGRSTMLDQKIPPMRRYPEALRLYRQALVQDPKNKGALTDKKLIEDVYKQMGRPVPK